MLNFRECGFTSKGYKNIWSHPQPHPAPCPVAQDHHAVSVPSQLCWDPPGGWILRWDDLGTSQSRRLLPDIISHPTISSNVKSDFCSKNIWISFGWVKNMWNHPTSNQLKIPTGTFQQWRTKMAPLTKMAAENLGTRVGVFFFFSKKKSRWVRALSYETTTRFSLRSQLPCRTSTVYPEWSSSIWFQNSNINKDMMCSINNKQQLTFQR